MKQPKVFHCRTSKTGPTHPVTLTLKKYTNNNALAVILQSAHAPWETFAVITVNLPTSGILPYDLAFVDTNNCPWAEDFLQENDIAHPTGRTGVSGFCEYPLYKFNKDSIWVEK